MSLERRKHRFTAVGEKILIGVMLVAGIAVVIILLEIAKLAF